MTTDTDTRTLEGEAGCRHFRAVMFAGVQSECEATHEDLKEDPDADPDLLAALHLIATYDFRV